MQAVGVQVVGFEVGGGDKTHTVGKQCVQQPVQDHGVGDVRHVKFVKTDQFVTLRHPATQLVERVDGALQVHQFAVHFTHEFVEMQARLALDRNGVKEAVHQETLAAPYAAIHVHPARDVRPVDEFLQCIGTPRLVLSPFASTTLQRLHRTQLRRVTLKAACGQFCFVGLFDVQDKFTRRLRFAFANPLAGGDTSELAEPDPQCLLEGMVCFISPDRVNAIN